MTTFDTLGLPENLLKSIAKNGFTTPTPIQAQSIPFALDGRDILGSAATGTGKTAAFAIPMIVKLMNNPKSMALVMTPTRELAAQVLATMHPLLLMERDIKTALLIGGEPMGKQFQQLKMQPRIIVGTPGRINDHLKRGSLMLNRADFLVLDETDRMLDMGFGVQIDEVIKYMPKTRQTLLFSATIPPEIIKIATRYQNNPARVSVDVANKPAVKIKQETIQTGDADKYKHLQAELETREGSIIIFVKTKFGAAKMAKRLVHEGHSSDAIHGDLQQRKRDRVIQNFRDKKIKVLVATDVAARGLDIPHIEHVINYDLPQVAEDYIHRIGRTARAGAEGNALSFLSPQDGQKWKAIQRLLNPDLKQEKGDASEGSGGRQRKGSGKSFGSKKPSWGKQRDQKSWGDKKKSFGGGKPARSRDDRPRDDRPRDDKPRWSEGDFREERPQQSRAPRQERSEGRSEAPRRSSEGGFRKERSENRFDNRAPRRDSARDEGNFRRERPAADGNRQPREDRRDDNRGNRSSEGRGNAPRRSEAGNRSNRSEGNFRNERPSADRPRRDDRFEDRSSRPRSNERSSERSDFRSDSRPSGGQTAKKRFGGSGGKPKFGGKPGNKPHRAGGDRPQQKRRAYN